MSLAQSPAIPTNGLVFYSDLSNIKSYKGPAIENKSTGIAAQNTSGTGYSFVGGTEWVDVPGIGMTNTYYCLAQNNYSAVSSWCCPNLFSNGGSWTCTPSTLYTYAIVYRAQSGYTHPNYMYRYEFTSNGGTLTIEQGIHNDNNRVHLGGGWYWAWGTFTTQSNSTWLSTMAFFYYRYSTYTDKVQLAKVLMTPGDYTGLHPKYWPNPTVTRSSTQAILDMTGNKEVTIGSVTYSNTGAISFNGSTNHITIPIPITPSSSYTVIQWCKPNTVLLQGATPTPTGLNRKTPLVGPGPTWNPGYWVTNDNFRVHGATQYRDIPITWTDSSWRMLGQTFDGTNCYAIYNENLMTGGTVTGYGPGSPSTIIFGESTGSSSYNWDGEIGVTLFYNRVLTPTEIKQIFYTHRAKYRQ